MKCFKGKTSNVVVRGDSTAAQQGGYVVVPDLILTCLLHLYEEIYVFTVSGCFWILEWRSRNWTRSAWSVTPAFPPYTRLSELRVMLVCATVHTRPHPR